VNNPSIVEFFQPPQNATWPPYGLRDGDFTKAVAEGCYLVISDDNNPLNAPQGSFTVQRGLRNGSVYRVGPHRPDILAQGKANGGDAWELVPGDDLRSIDENIPPHPYTNSTIKYSNHAGGTARAFIVGKGFTKPKPVGNGAGTDLTFSGPPMDIGIYRAVIQLK
jgi:hypothetical protein